MRAKNNRDLMTEGFLLNHPNFVAKSETASFGAEKPTWKTETLTAELLPTNLLG